MKERIKRHFKIKKLFIPLSSELYSRYKDNTITYDYLYIYLFGVLIIKWRLK